MAPFSPGLAPGIGKLSQNPMALQYSSKCFIPFFGVHVLFLSAIETFVLMRFSPVLPSHRQSGWRYGEKILRDSSNNRGM
jgi:hypothetical protein